MTRAATPEENADHERDLRKHDAECPRCGLLSGHCYPCTDVEQTKLRSIHDRYIPRRANYDAYNAPGHPGMARGTST